MALPQAGVELIAAGLGDYLSGLSKADTASQTFFKGLDDGARRTSSFSEIATGALRRVGEVAVNALGSATQAVVGFASDSIQIAGNYEAALQGFSAISGEALAEVGFSLDDVSKKALELGKSTAYSSQQALDAMTELTKGGVDIQSVMTDATDATLALASASGMQLAPAAEIVAKQLGIWGDTGLKAANVADLLAQGANASTTDVEGLALGLANAGGVAKLMGATFEDTVTTLALLAPGFSSSADAGTALKTTFSRLSPASKEAKLAMQALGIITEDGKNKFYDASGSLKGMSEVAQILQDSLKGLSNEEKQVALNTIFGSDAIRAAALLAEAGAEGFDAMATSMGKAGGAMAQAAERNKGLNFAMESLKGSIETVQIVIGMALIPVLTTLLNDYVIPAVNYFLEFSQGILSSEKPLDSLANVIESVLPGFKAFMLSLSSLGTGKIIPALQSLASTIMSVLAPAFEFIAQNIMPALTMAIDFVSANFEAFKGALMGIGALLLGPLVMGAISAIGAALATLLSPVMLVVGAAALLGAAWSTNFLGIQDIVIGFVNYLIGAFQPVIAAFQQFGAGALQEITTFVTGGQTQFNNLTAILGSIGAFVSQVLTDLVGYVQANLPIWIATLQMWGVAAWQWIQPAISAAMAKIAEWGTSLLSYLAANLPTWIAQLLQWGTAAAEWIGKAIPPLLVKAGEFLGALLEWMLGTALPAIIETAVQWGEAIYNWVADVAIPKIGPALMNFLKTMLASMAEILKAMIKAAKEIGDGIIDGLSDAIKDGASSVVSAIISMVTQAIEAAKRALGIASPSKEFASLGAETMAGFAQGIKENEKEPSVAAIRAARKTIDQVLGALKGVEGHGISDEITEVLESWSTTVGSLTDLFDNLEKLAGFKKFNSESFRKAVVEGTAGVLNGLREAANYISAQFKAYTGKQLDAMEVRGTVQELLDNWINSIGSIAGMIENLKALFAFGKRKTLDAFLDSVRTGTGALIDALRAAAQIVVERFSTANLGMPTISDEIQAMLDNWTGLIQTITDALTNIKKLWSFGKSNTEGLKESVYDAVIKIMEAMNAVQQAVTDSKPVQTAANLMQDALNQNLASSDIQVKVPQISMTMGQNTGVAIIDGMEGAIRKSGVRVADALVDVVTSAIDAAKKALGIASPSKVFFEVGMNTAEGLGLGIERGGYRVVDVMSDTLGRMINAIPGVGRGNIIAPPMSGQQIAHNSVINNSNQRTFNWSPTYNTAPPQQIDFAIANAMAGGY